MSAIAVPTASESRSKMARGSLALSLFWLSVMLSLQATVSVLLLLYPDKVSLGFEPVIQHM